MREAATAQGEGDGAEVKQATFEGDSDQLSDAFA